jgi:hypothetical protein
MLQETVKNYDVFNWFSVHNEAFRDHIDLFNEFFIFILEKIKTRIQININYK